MQVRVVRTVSVGSAARVAFAFTLTLASVVLVGLVALYALAAASGVLSKVEGFIAGLGLSDTSFHLNLLSLLPGFVIVSVIACGAAAAFAAISAMLYNTLSEIIGGVEVVTRER